MSRTVMAILAVALLSIGVQAGEYGSIDLAAYEAGPTAEIRRYIEAYGDLIGGLDAAQVRSASTVSQRDGERRIGVSQQYAGIPVSSGSLRITALDSTGEVTSVDNSWRTIPPSTPTSPAIDAAEAYSVASREFRSPLPPSQEQSPPSLIYYVAGSGDSPRLAWKFRANGWGLFSHGQIYSESAPCTAMRDYVVDAITSDVLLSSPGGPMYFAGGCMEIGAALDSGYVSGNPLGSYVADHLRLSAAPNPFNPATTIHWTSPLRGRVLLVVRSATGQHVSTLVDDFLPGGEHDFVWDGRDASGRVVATGVYFVRLETYGAGMARRVTLVR